MPYSDPERQREYNRAWARRKRDTAARSPMAEDVMSILRLYTVPLSPSEIHSRLQCLRPTSTLNSLGTCLDRMQHGGRVVRVGYGQWQVPRERAESTTDDQAIAALVHERDTADTGERFTLDEVLADEGMTRDDLNTEEDA